MLSSDRNILASESSVSKRIKEYGDLVEELHIVLLSDSSHELKDTQLGKNVWVYPTNSSINFLRPLDAARIGKKVVFDKKFVRGKSVITAQDPFECGWVALKVKNKWRLPLEVQLHTDPFSPYFSGFQNKVRKFFAGKIIRNADAIRVVSENLKSRILNIKPNANIYVLPIYIDKEKIENALMKFDIHSRYPWHFIMLAVSRLAPEKNLGMALRVLSLVRQRFPDTGMVVVGDGNEEGKLKSMAKSLNLEAAVIFLGWQNELASFYKTANVFIQTSLFEGYGLSLVEAGLSGLPVVTTPVGIASELEHGRDAYVYPADRVDLFASGIVDLLENNFKRENLKINLKRTLDAKLISKEEYLARMKDGWAKLSQKIQA